MLFALDIHFWLKLCVRFFFPCVLLPLGAAAGHRMWALQRLRKLLTTEYGQSININRLLGDSEGEARSMVSLAETNTFIVFN